MKNDKNILIIEPLRRIGLELQCRLEKRGFSVERPISLVDTEVLLSKHTPNFIVADSGIKDLSLFKRIEKYLKRFHTPVIWIGEPKRKGALKEPRSINVIATLIKPFDRAQVLSRIIKYFNKKHPSAPASQKV